jgi:phosphinothricin acetyltransferase
MKIRLAGQGDLEAINRIYNQAVHQRFCTAHLERVGMEDRRRWFAGHDPVHFPVFVALEEENVAGWVSLGAYRENRQALAHVAELSYYVDELARGKGIGSGLLNHAIHVAPEYGFSVLIAILLNRNLVSIALLNKYGFAEWGRMPGIAKIDDQLADHLYFGLRL